MTVTKRELLVVEDCDVPVFEFRRGGSHGEEESDACLRRGRRGAEEGLGQDCSAALAPPQTKPPYANKTCHACGNADVRGK